MRKTKARHRVVLPDPKFHEVDVTRFVNNMMFDGKKSVAFSIFYDALDLVDSRMKEHEGTVLDVWRKALENVTPQVEVKSRRVGGATFQVPVEVRGERKESIAMKNLILYARKRPGHAMSDRLANEIIAAYNQEGGAYRRKEDIHKMAEANKAFAHFRY